MKAKRIIHAICVGVLCTDALLSTTPVSADTGNIVMIGDSRYCGTYVSVTGRSSSNGFVNDTVGDTTWICGGGQGYAWFRDEALPQAEAHITDGTRVVVNMGCNRTSGVSAEDAAAQYASLLRNAAEDWGNVDIYYVSVYPVNSASRVDSAYLETFNSAIEQELSDFGTYIDVYGLLQGYASQMSADGTHYGRAASVVAYEETLRQIEEHPGNAMKASWDDAKDLYMISGEEIRDANEKAMEQQFQAPDKTVFYPFCEDFDTLRWRKK